MASERTLDALRALAERPGTEHEGILARQMLERMQGVPSADLTLYRRWLRYEITLDELVHGTSPTRLTPEEQMVVDEAAKLRYLSENFKKGDRIVFKKRKGTVVAVTGWKSIVLKLDDCLWPRPYVAWDKSGWIVKPDTQKPAR